MSIHQFLRYAAGLFILGAAVLAHAQDEQPARLPDVPALAVGSRAPSLDIEHWLQDGGGKFRPVADFEEGKVYVVCFWATSCGPCVGELPDMAKLQTEFADRDVQIISVSNEAREDIETFLRNPVPDDDKTYDDVTSAWCLTTDPDGSTHQDYLTAAGENAIPTAFIVGKSGLIEWIGHPSTIRDVLTQVVEDRWDRRMFALSHRQGDVVDVVQARVFAKMNDGDATGAIATIDDAIERMKNDEKLEPVVDSLRHFRSEVVLSTGSPGAAAAFRELVRDGDAARLHGMARIVVTLHDRGDRPADDVIAAAVNAVEKAAGMEPQDGAILETLARLVYHQGNLDRAIELMEKAVELDGDNHPEFAEFLAKLIKEKAGGQ